MIDIWKIINDYNESLKKMQEHTKSVFDEWYNEQIKDQESKDQESKS